MLTARGGAAHIAADKKKNSRTAHPRASRGTGARQAWLDPAADGPTPFPGHVSVSAVLLAPARLLRLSGC
jgi:hypothetical protein